MAIVAAGELFGGVERHVLDLSEALAARGYPVSLILFHDAELAARARARGQPLELLPAGCLATLAAARQLAARLERDGVEIVHSHGYKATVVCALARRHRRFALVKTEHGLPEHAGRLHPGGLRTRLYAALDRSATRATAAAVCYVTQDLGARLARSHAGLRSHVVPNGIPAMERRALPKPAEMAAGRLDLAIVGRLDRVKGHRVAIEALAALDPGAREPHLYLIGDGPEEPALRALAAARGVERRVHFLGFRRDAHCFIAHADALLMPSLHEGLPYTLLEAMALGTPVIASDVGGLAQVGRERRCALLVPPADPAALARAVARLRADPALRGRLVANAREVQARAYSLDAMASRYLAIYGALGG